MKITEIEGRWVKVGQTSITVKNDDTGKTAGVVRNVRKFFDLPNNRQFEQRKKIRTIWCSGKIDNAIFDGEKWYYLNNVNSDPYYTAEEMAKKTAFLENVANSGVQVINVRF